MSAQRKPEKFPVQVLSLDAIKVDHDLQSRVATSIEFQREFSAAMLRGDVFPPVTVFCDGKDYWLADGFHRYGAAREASKVDRNFRGLRAEVREGTREDAVLFSAGANQRFSIPRTDEDKRKAVWMLLEVPACRDWAINRIAEHVGLGGATATKHRLAYFQSQGINLPPEVRTRAGHTRRTRYAEPFTPVAKKNTAVKSGISYYAKDGKGGRISLGGDPALAAQKARQLRSESLEEDAARWHLGPKKDKRVNVSRRFACRGVLLEGCDSFTGLGIRDVSVWCYTGHGRVVVWAELDAPEALPLHVGVVLLARQHVGPLLRAVVVCYHGDAPPALLDLARALCVEFRTPDELVAEVAAERAAAAGPAPRAPRPGKK